MGNTRKTTKWRGIPRRIWAGLCLMGLLLSLALALLPPAAHAQVDFDCANVTEIPQPISSPWLFGTNCQVRIADLIAGSRKTNV